MLRLRCGRPRRGRQPRAERSGRRRADVRRGPSLPGMVTRVHHPRGVTAVFNGNLAMATPEGNSVFVGGSESTLGRPGVRGRVREGPRTNGKSKCSETRPMGAGRKCAEESAAFEGKARSAAKPAARTRTNRIGRALRVAMPPAERFNTFKSHPTRISRRSRNREQLGHQMQNPEKTLRAPRRNVLIYLPIYSAPAEE